jgi:hypothetical protein
MVAYNTLEQALADVGVTLIDVNQHADQYGKNVMVIVAVGTDQQIQALVIAALRRCFTAISELSNNISAKRTRGVKDYHFTGRYRTLLTERVDMSVGDEVVQDEIESSEGDTVPTETEQPTLSAKRKGR